MQSRFKRLTDEQINQIQNTVTERYESLLAQEACEQTK
jgi:hypothetical protein